jgi:dolichol-phosphate mannosyltransferase
MTGHTLPHCLVVVPTYDEAASIQRFVDNLLAAVNGMDADVLVVDDDSPDGTGDLVRAHAAFGHRLHLVTRPAKDGLGAAYRAGFAWAVDRGYDVVVQVDADGSHPVDRIETMVVALGRYDVVIGSRYVFGGSTVDWPRSRRRLSVAANRYARLVLGLRTRDSTAGFRAWRTRTLVDLDLLHSASSGYCFQIETTLRAERAGARILEVPITFTERSRGLSKLDRAVVVEAAARVALWRARELTTPPRGGRAVRARGAV